VEKREKKKFSQLQQPSSRIATNIVVIFGSFVWLDLELMMRSSIAGLSKYVNGWMAVCLLSISDNLMFDQ
jgi:hypothetical protein